MNNFDELVGKRAELWNGIFDRLSESDLRPASEQLGLQRRMDFKLDSNTMVLNPDSQSAQPESAMAFRDEKLFLYYDGSFVLIMKPNGSWRVGRVE